MKKIDQEYNKRFTNQELPNEGFDVDGLWDDISKGLETIPSNSTKVWWNRKWLLGSVFVCLIASVCILYPTTAEIHPKAEITLEKTSIDYDIKISNHIETVKASSADNNGAIETLNANAIQNEYINDNAYYNGQTSKFENEFTSSVRLDSEKKHVSDKASLSVKSNNNRIELKKFAKIESKNVPQKNNSGRDKSVLERSLRNDAEIIAYPLNNFSNKNIDVVKNEQFKKEIRNDIIDISNELVSKVEPTQKNYMNDESTPFLSTELFPLTSTQQLLYRTVQDLPKPYESYYEVDILKPKAHSWQFSLLGGANNSIFNFKSEESSALAELKSETENGQLGYNLGLKAAMVLHNKWLFISGLEFQNVSSLFDIVQTTNLQILKEDQIVKFLIDDISGDTIGTVVEDVLLDSMVTRTIVHRNRYQQFSIPLEFGIQKSHRNFIFGFQAGLSFNFITSQSGKTLDPSGEIVSFNSGDTFTPFRAFHLGFRVSPLIGYRVSKRWALTFQPQWAFNPQAGFDNSDIKLRSSQFNFNVGVQYSIDGM